jgi:hypothetical protein
MAQGLRVGLKHFLKDSLDGFMPSVFLFFYRSLRGSRQMIGERQEGVKHKMLRKNDLLRI